MTPATADQPRSLRLLGAASPLLFAAAAVSVLILFGRVGLKGPESAAQAGAAMAADPVALGAASFMAAVAGLAVAALVATLDHTVRRVGGAGLPLTGILAGAFWSFGWILAGIGYFGALELTGYYESPELAKTLVLIAWEGTASPPVIACSAALIAATAWATLRGGGLPRWYGRWSAACAALVFAGAASLALSFSGMVGVVFLPLWLVTTAVVLLRAAWATPGSVAADAAAA